MLNELMPNDCQLCFICISWLNRLTRTIPGYGSDVSKAQMLADLEGDMDDQTSQYLTSLNELNNAKQLV